MKRELYTSTAAELEAICALPMDVAQKQTEDLIQTHDPQLAFFPSSEPLPVAVRNLLPGNDVRRIAQELQIRTVPELPAEMLRSYIIGAYCLAGTTQPIRGIAVWVPRPEAPANNDTMVP